MPLSPMCRLRHNKFPKHTGQFLRKDLGYAPAGPLLPYLFFLQRSYHFKRRRAVSLPVIFLPLDLRSKDAQRLSSLLLISSQYSLLLISQLNHYQFKSLLDDATGPINCLLFSNNGAILLAGGELTAQPTLLWFSHNSQATILR